MQHKKKSTIHLNKYILLELALIGLAIMCCLFTYYKTCTAEVITRQYLQAYAVGDFEQMFEYLLFDEIDGEQVTKNSFQAAGEVCYNYQELPIKTVTSVWKSKATYNKATVCAQYTNAEGFQRETIELQRKGIFWKVIERELETPIMQDIILGVPEKSKLMMDGLPIKREQFAHTQHAIDWYQLKGAFGGIHMVQCFHEEREAYQGVRNFIAKDESITEQNYIHMPLKEAGYLELEALAIYDWTQILAAVIDSENTQKLTNEFKDAFANTKEGGMKSSLEEIRKAIYTHWGWQNIKGYVLREHGYTVITNTIRDVKNSSGIVEEFTVVLHPIIKEEQENKTQAIIQNKITIELTYVKGSQKWELVTIKVI